MWNSAQGVFPLIFYEYKLNLISDRVNSQLNENFEKSNKTFMNVLERLNKIDEAQKKIDSLSTDIVSLQGILTDKKSRGIFGEVNLTHILSSLNPEIEFIRLWTQKEAYVKMQGTGIIADMHDILCDVSDVSWEEVIDIEKRFICTICQTHVQISART